MQYYNRLSLEERENINHYLKLGVSITKIAQYLNRSKSTIVQSLDISKAIYLLYLEQKEQI